MTSNFVARVLKVSSSLTKWHVWNIFFCIDFEHKVVVLHKHILFLQIKTLKGQIQSLPY
jgi:hypothetical protein